MNHYKMRHGVIKCEIYTYMVKYKSLMRISGLVWPKKTFVKYMHFSIKNYLC